MTILAANMASPEIIPQIDEVLGEMREEWLELLDLRKMAVRRHGEIGNAPAMPTAVEPQANQQSERRSASGNVASLVRRYRDDKRSSYHKLRFKTREHYDSLIKRLIEDGGDKNLVDLNQQSIGQLYDGWAKDNKIAMGHAMISILRLVVNYGATILEDGECARLSVILRNMRVAAAKPRTERLTAEQITAIIAEAHEMGLHSIALAQAFQSDCGLRQRDVIGEWVPESEPGESDVHDEGSKWLRGIKWSEIDNMILRHKTSHGLKDIEINLRDAPRVMKELARYGGTLPISGPIIVSEVTKRAYINHHFRRVWREVADAAGIPKNVKNMDSSSQ